MKEFKSRREFLFESCGGLSGLALAYLLDQDGLLASDACSVQTPGDTSQAAKNPPTEAARGAAMPALSR